MSFQSVLGLTNSALSFTELNLILPIGISFYTFQTISYTVDVYYGRTPAERNLGIFALYVSFFPQLIAGPIERASKLIPQFKLLKEFDHDCFRRGTFRMAIGFFKKIVIADRLALFVDPIFNYPLEYGSLQIVFATLFFGLEIYCDFSGYCDIAIGAAQVFGINLSENFNRPYFSTNIRAFWTRWHITLSQFFRDYLYLPLGGNKGNPLQKTFRILIVFSLAGLWHGANITFLLWGLYHALLLGSYRMVEPFRKYLFQSRTIFSIALNNFIGGIVTFVCVTFGWIFFRANKLSDLEIMFSKFQEFNLDFYDIYFVGFGRFDLLIIIFFVLFMLSSFFLRNELEKIVEKFFSLPRFIKYPIYTLMIGVILFLGIFDQKEFIYFQF